MISVTRVQRGYLRKCKHPLDRVATSEPSMAPGDLRSRAQSHRLARVSNAKPTTNAFDRAADARRGSMTVLPMILLDR